MIFSFERNAFPNRKIIMSIRLFYRFTESYEVMPIKKMFLDNSLNLILD